MSARLILLIFVVIGFTSCMKEDMPIELPPHGEATSQTLRLGTDYSTQFYYDLRNARVVHSSKVDSWHLAFESSANGEAVFLNGGNSLALIKTDKTDFDDVTIHDCEGELWLQDDPNGSHSESAFGNWNLNQITRDKIYIVRMDPMNKELKTIKLHSVDAESFTFEVGEIGSTDVSPIKITKDPTRIYTYFDLNALQTCGEVEPVKESWDFVITRYGFTFYDQDPPLPYIVTGVLSNPHTAVYKDSLHSFYEIDGSIIPQSVMSIERDVIGYDWKNYDFDLGIYHVRQDYNYIIKTQSNEYYKLRFLSFYDNNGLKGTPTFEFKQIQ